MMCNSVNSYIQEQTRLMHIAHRKKRLHMETPNGRLKVVVKKKIEEKRCTREIIHKKKLPMYIMQSQATKSSEDNK